jgi:hypothetical protein
VQQWRERRLRISARMLKSLKIVNLFTRALAPPFIGRWKDLYIPKTPSSSKNIPNVNTYKNVFFISYIYKLTTSSQSKPDFLGWQLWLCFPLVREFPVRDFRNRLRADFRIFHPPKFVTSPMRDSWLSRVHDSEALQVQDSRKSHIRDSEASQVQDSRKSHIRDSEASQVQDSWKSHVPCPWKTYLKNFVKLDVLRVTGFPEFPNTGWHK